MITGENETRQKESKLKESRLKGRNNKPQFGQAEASAENQRIIDSYDYLTNAASTQDCTGLIPSAPQNDEELESYDALYKYQPPKIPAPKDTP